MAPSKTARGLRSWEEDWPWAPQLRELNLSRKLPCCGLGSDSASVTLTALNSGAVSGPLSAHPPKAAGEGPGVLGLRGSEVPIPLSKPLGILVRGQDSGEAGSGVATALRA